MEIAELLPSFSEKDETDQQKLVEAIKRWLERCEQPWLLIFDNADDLSLVHTYLPQHGNGSILLTTRAYAVGSLATPVEVETMGFLEGTQLLLRRAQRFEHPSDEEINQAGNIVVALDHFPLALDQAGAYLEETQCSFKDYLDLYQTHSQAQLARRGMRSTDYPHSVATTWLHSFQKVEQTNPAAAELLQLCSFLAPDRIPEELLKDGGAYWPASLQQAIADPLLFQQLMADLLKFSLVRRLVEEHALSIHRLVQAVQRDRMEQETQRQWAERVVRAVKEVFPENPQDLATWSQCLRYLSQAQACYTLVEQYTLMLIEAASLLNRTFVYLMHHALYTIAESVIQRALSICEKRLGPEHTDTAGTLNNLAFLYKSQGRYMEAEPLFQRALSICEKRLGPEHPDTASSLNNLAILNQDQGKYAQAEALLRRALAVYEQRLGPEHPQTASSLDNLAGIYESQGRYPEAEPLYQRALSIYERLLGPLHPDTAQSLDHLAELYHIQGKYVEAETLYLHALSIYEQQLGSLHPETSSIFNNLARLYEDIGRYAEAEPLYQRALSIREQQLGSLHPDMAESLNNLAALYEKQGKYTEAESLYQRALAICEQQLGAQHPSTQIVRGNYAALLRTMGRDAKAKKLEEGS